MVNPFAFYGRVQYVLRRSTKVTTMKISEYLRRPYIRGVEGAISRVDGLFSFKEEHTGAWTMVCFDKGD